MECVSFLRSSTRRAGLAGCIPLIAACAVHPALVDRDASTCGTLPAPFGPPVYCSVPKQGMQHFDDASRHENSCFDIAFEPASQGSMRIPSQVVCPFFKSLPENKP